MKDLPTFQQINAALEYCKYSGCLRWRYRDDASKRTNSRLAGKVAGTADPKGYLKINITISGTIFYLKNHRIAWLLMTGEWPVLDVDHRDGVRNNNSWGNLRLATPSQNMANRKAHSRSGFKGCNYDRRRNKWRARITIGGNYTYLGSFNTPEEAYEAYCSAAKIAHGEFAKHISEIMC